MVSFLKLVPFTIMRLITQDHTELCNVTVSQLPYNQPFRIYAINIFIFGDFFQLQKVMQVKILLPTRAIQCLEGEKSRVDTLLNVGLQGFTPYFPQQAEHFMGSERSASCSQYYFFCSYTMRYEIVVPSSFITIQMTVWSAFQLKDPPISFLRFLRTLRSGAYPVKTGGRYGLDHGVKE
ncbi:hypothetical protein OXYTRIMIC_430 [Oxytricha trifallax]|uniref:Uncharacterized protein n=1 Tax=Oxytricha trifallax TaxID=1172189 RepID=A0A073HYU2_9SPIT|nr:hypothetical protein OXYTRIMIC_430 [Oxytricha trifallax]